MCRASAQRVRAARTRVVSRRFIGELHAFKTCGARARDVYRAFVGLRFCSSLSAETFINVPSRPVEIERSRRRA